MKVWAAAMSHRSSGELFAVGCSQAVSSWAHGRFGLVGVEDLAVALSGSLGQKRKKKKKKIGATTSCNQSVDIVG